MSKQSLYEKRIKEARKQFLILNDKQNTELLNLYQDLAQQLHNDIIKCRTTSEKRYLNNLSEIVNANVQDMINKIQGIVTDNITTSSEIAASTDTLYYSLVTDSEGGKHLSKVFLNSALSTSRQTVINLIQGKYYKDGATLSSRIWNIAKNNKDSINNLIQVNVLRGANSKELAKQVEQYVNPFKRTNIKNDFVGYNQDISYEAARLARTSITHSFRETQIHEAMNNPLNLGMKWELSVSHGMRMHGKTDICDEYANQNNYGLGVGVFPADKMPIGHPQCLCITYEVNTNIDDAISRVKAWAKGGEDENLNRWYIKNNKKTNSADEKNINTDVGNHDIIKSNKLIETENKLKKLNVTQYTSRRKLGRDILDSLDLNDVPVSVRKISANGFCSLNGGDNLDKINITEYVLNSKDCRENNYKIKTAFHEAFHAKAHGMKTDYFSIKKEWIQVEETLTESAAHYMVKQLGIEQEIVPSYAEKLVDMLPRLKQLDKFKDCSKISDFGMIAWEDRLNGVEPIWAELYDDCMKIKHDWKEYSKQYSEYITKHKDELIDKMLENMPKYTQYKEQMIGECKSAIESVNEGRKLTGNEPMILRNVLIIAMNRIGVK